LSDDRIDESSGIAPSHIHEGIYYTHNDSGDTARVFAFDKSGKTVATVNLDGVDAVDCEDMASAVIDGKPTVYLGDIGDNKAKRKSIAIYRFTEPASLNGESHQSPEVIELTYPDGAHNAETLLVHPTTGAIAIVTKTSNGPSGIYTLTDSPTPGKHNLKKIGEIEVAAIVKMGHLITGGCWSPDAKHVVLRTYLQGYEFAVPDNGEWWKSDPACVKTALELQGEGITYSPKEDRFLTTSEGKPCVVNEIPIKK